MIISFGSKATESIYNGMKVRSMPTEIQQTARRKLRMINNAQNLTDLSVPPANRLEKLHASEFFSNRINKQWRIVFKWTNNNAYEVEIVDYH